MEQGFDNLEVSTYRPKPTDLAAFLPFACRQLEAPFRLRILLETIDEYVSKAGDKGGKSKRNITQQALDPGQSSAQSEPSFTESYPVNEVVLHLRCDSAGHPVELLFRRCRWVPRLLLKIIRLCVPFHELLTKVTLRWSPLDGASLYELAKFLPLSQIAEMVLDDSPVSHRNYHLLLEPPSRLSVLSLARCKLRDEECVALAARLAYPLPASRTLVCLSLESNFIGDEGARALAVMLRTNRTLRHLNLAGNAITSVGAAHLFRILVPFPVSADDIYSTRRRTFEYLKMRKAAYERYFRLLTELGEPAVDSGRVRSSRARKLTAVSPMGDKTNQMDSVETRAETLASELVGPRMEPFEWSELMVRDGTTNCVGNFSLIYLNLSYNDLDCTSARRLSEVLAYQARTGRWPGLLRAQLEGNPLYTDCELARSAQAQLQQMLEETLGAMLETKQSRKSERPKFK